MSGTKFDLKLYHFFSSGVLPLDLPKNTKKQGYLCSMVTFFCFILFYIV